MYMGEMLIPETTTSHGSELSRNDQDDQLTNLEQLNIHRRRCPMMSTRVSKDIFNRDWESSLPFVGSMCITSVQQDGLGVLTVDLSLTRIRGNSA